VALRAAAGALKQSEGKAVAQKSQVRCCPPGGIVLRYIPSTKARNALASVNFN